MPRSDYIRTEGRVVDVYPNSIFKVELENKHNVMCSLAGKLRINNIRILNGDRVDIELSPYDINKGRIVWCHR